MFQRFLLFAILVIGSGSMGLAEELLFEDRFEGEPSTKWELVGLKDGDYRIRNGGLEVRLRRPADPKERPMLRVNLPFTTADTVIASVEVDMVSEPMPRDAYAGVFLTAGKYVSFGGRKTNIDGYHVFSPGEVDFIGKPGQEGDPNNYTVKYWPATKSAGPLRVIIRHHYAHFQVGPATDGTYKTFFHSAIQEENQGLGFALMAIGASDDKEVWVRFDNFRVEKL